MANSVLQNTCYFIIITICIDKGDGRWKERDRNNLRHDIELYKSMAEKIEREIDAFYDEYPDGSLEGNNVDVTHYKHVTNTLNRAQTKTVDENERAGRNNISIKDGKNITNDVSMSKHTDSEISASNHSDKEVQSSVKWPKFDDFLLAMGKKYDWKNDRWIKVKEKFKSSKMNARNYKKNTEEDNLINIHENHKFSYRFVKLNRTKSRRSIVVAVSAIR